MKLAVLDLFSGIGGFSLGLERAGLRTVAFCEIDLYCRAVLRKHWPHVPCHEDIRSLTGRDVGSVDVICGGYPCQPYSLAGKRGGAADDRHLWPEMYRLVRELRPAWVLGENVAGHINMGLDGVLSDLEAAGYCTRAFVIPAVAVDAPHRRERVWIVANADGGRCLEPGTGQAEQPGRAETECASEAVAHTSRHEQGRALEWSERERIRTGSEPESLADTEKPAFRPGLCAGESGGQRRRRSGDSGGADNVWLPEPRVGRVAHGVPHRVDRLRALGNAVVPQVAEAIGRAIMEAA